MWCRSDMEHRAGSTNRGPEPARRPSRTGARPAARRDSEMAVFRSREQALSVFTSLFETLLKEPAFVARMTEAELSLRMIQSKPDFQLYVSPIGIYLDDAEAPAVLTVRLSGDTAHQMCSGGLALPLAIATGRIRIRGGFHRLREFAPLLRAIRDRYPAIAAGAGVPSWPVPASG